MKAKQILAIFIVMLLVAMAVPFVASAQTEQYWYLNDTTSTAGRVMDKNAPDATDTSVSIDNGSSVVWVSDEDAQVDVTFPADTWGGLIRFTTAPPNGTETIVLDVGYSDNTDGNFTSNGVTQLLSPDGETVFTIAIGASLFTVNSDKYLAFKVTNNTGAQVSVDTGGGGQSQLISPATDPGFPIPELPTIVLLATGLVFLAGYFGLKRRKRAYLKA